MPPQLLSEALADRRNCRSGLVGLTVIAGGRHDEIRHTAWDKDSKLVVTLESGDVVSPDQCRLVSPWPVTCCRPSKRKAVAR